MSTAITRGVEVQVSPHFHPEHSKPEQQHWFFSYTVRITNQGDETVQLLARRWIITNSNGEAEVVTGPGVVGEQPVLAPGETFAYTSFCPLDTSLGSMHGSFQLETGTGERFEAEIAPFTLADPDSLH